jgi:MoaA/NifB/PqqE/SkfB family radical SAM enzyme
LDHSISTNEAKQVSVSLVSVVATAEPQEAFTLTVKLCNGSASDLDTSGPYPVYLAHHWFNQDHTALKLDAFRVPLDLLKSGRSRDYSIVVTAPETSGKCILRVTLVQEMICWFDQPEIGVFADAAIIVEEKPWWNDSTKSDIPFGHLAILNRHVFSNHLSHRGKCRPLMLHVETVNICNLKCIICPYGEMTRTRETMPITLFEKIVSDYCAMGGGDVIMTPQVGDVFLDKLLVQRIRLLHQNAAIRSLGFVTNGANAHVFSDQDLDFIVNSCTRINVSVYGLDEEEYAIMSRREQRYSRMVDCIQRMSGLNRNCQIVIAARLLRKYEDAFIRSWMINNFGREFPYEAITDFGNWAGAMDTSKPLPFDATWLSSDAADRLENGGPCTYPILHLKVMVNGDVKFCSCVDYDNNPENTIGNVRDQSLSEIYNGNRARHLWQQGLSMCNGCTHRHPLSELPALARYFAHPIKHLGV